MPRVDAVVANAQREGEQGEGERGDGQRQDGGGEEAETPVEAGGGGNAGQPVADQRAPASAVGVPDAGPSLLGARGAWINLRIRAISSVGENGLSM